MELLALGILIGIISLIVIIGITIKGLSLCKQNNAIGVLLLFISLNIVGLILGGAILLNIKNNNDEILRGNLSDYLKKQEEVDKKLIDYLDKQLKIKEK